MKNKVIYRGVLLLLAGSLFASCTREVPDIFDVPGAQRLQEAMNEIEQTLVAAPNGWEMRYYTQPETAGYVMLVKFDASGRVTVAAKNAATTSNRYTSAVSTWEVIGDNGPVITFNSYNDVLHAFSDPQNDGVGLGGDYEFIVLDWADASHLRLKGKKAEAYIDMYALDPAQDWEDYYAKIDAFNTIVFTNNDGAVFDFVAAGTTREVEYAQNMFQFTDETVPFGFIVLPTGVELYSGIVTANGDTARHFVLNEDMSALVCNDEGVDAKFVQGQTGAEYFVSYLAYSSTRSWVMDLGKMGNSSQNAYQSITDALASNGVALRGVEMRDNDSICTMKISYRLSNSSNNYSGLVYGKFELTEAGNVHFVYESADDDATGLFNGVANMDAEAGRKMLIDDFFGRELFCVPHSGGTLNYSELRMVAPEDNEFYFVSNKQ